MPIFKNVVDSEGVLDWTFNENLNRLEYLSDTNSPTLEVLIRDRLTTLFFNNIQVTKNGIKGYYSIPDEVFGEETPICVPAVAQNMQKADESKLGLLNATCKQALEFLKTDFGLSEVECISYIDSDTNALICEVLLALNETNKQEFVIKLWKFNS